MQRSPHAPPAPTAATTSAHVTSASARATTSASGAVMPPRAAVKVVTKDLAAIAALQAPRRALQPLDSNQQASALVAKPAAVAKAPFAYVSRFSRPLPTRPPVTTPATSLTGFKRKQQSLEDLVARQQQAASGADKDEAEQRARENVAWLDMLVALLERKYQAYAPPVGVAELESARLLDAYWAKTTPAKSDSNKKSRLLTDAATSKEDEKEEKRTQALRRHAQQIQDTSVASTSCCGCKTGCLKMYCVCFSTRGYCHDGCSCDNCKNARASGEQRLEAITSYLMNDPRAFSYAAAVATGATSGFFQLLPEKSSTVVLRGCRCKKSKCLKKYCECFQNGLGCGPHCRCVDCANDASAAARELRDKNKSDASAVSAAGASAAGGGSGAAAGGGFHAIKVAVTKKPRRNVVLKTVRLRL